MDLLKPNSANSSPLTPLGFLERASTVYGDCTSIVYNNSTFTWSQTHQRCLQIASAIASLGIQRGHVVSVLAPNIPAMYELHFAVPMAGAILNTINTRLDARTISVLLCHSKSKLIFVDSLSRSLLLEALSLFPANTERPSLIFIADDEDPSLTVDVNRTYEGLLKTGDPRFNWIRPENEWDPMILNYTSGTTSAPKGVVHCHRGIFIITVDSLIDWSVPKQCVYLWTLPMFHANGWSFPWGMAAVGGTNICLRKFDAATIYGAIRQHSVTHLCGAPVVLNMLANAPDRQPLQNPVQVLTAGAPPPAAVLFRTESLGFVVSHGYGLTETAGLAISCAWKREWNRFPATEQARLKARQGVRTVAMAEVDVVDAESGVSVKRDGSSLGEIVLRGGCVMLGYLNDPAGTAKCIRNGWFYTGDVGVIHADGYIEIKDRSKDVIISGGENLSSVEVESVLYTNPAINEAAVVARPDDFWGETPCAFVSLKSSLSDKEKPSEKEIIVYCRSRMPHYMVPKTVVFTADLPKTSTGKIQKFVLRDMAKALGSSRVSRM
ncbi:2-methylpropanoate--CoA ligase CCL4-like [Telopea speciosissima]|uniref:2-methylpropanoate--CoA ligase CCL4-like n=1 Tax=Telopea speciosissima TaxID=54955 RepID=UPI001CC54FC5|nr:2-methylpropanoate--CoA ligase CCL4-like [Telopea speciosissima]